jgi:hypothetical protein
MDSEWNLRGNAVGHGMNQERPEDTHCISNLTAPNRKAGGWGNPPCIRQYMIQLCRFDTYNILITSQCDVIEYLTSRTLLVRSSLDNCNKLLIFRHHSQTPSVACTEVEPFDIVTYEVHVTKPSIHSLIFRGF